MIAPSISAARKSYNSSSPIKLLTEAIIILLDRKPLSNLLYNIAALNLGSISGVKSFAVLLPTVRSTPIVTLSMSTPIE